MTRASPKHVTLCPGLLAAGLGTECCVRGRLRDGVGLSAVQGGLCLCSPDDEQQDWWDSRLRAFVFSVNPPTAQETLEQRMVRCTEDSRREQFPSFGFPFLVFFKISLCLRDCVLSRKVHWLNNKLSCLWIPDTHGRQADLVGVLLQGFHEPLTLT